ncbi:MAG: GNAT family N-acetyltransferase [Actinomycetia bacterium]|nr:GNAT family N-acetyltransferase [Actinomycetes bacterium]
MGPRLSLTCVRYATAEDLALLADIEAEADTLFRPLWEGSGQDWASWPGTMSGQERAAQPGFILVAGQPAVGFAHVLDLAAVGGSGLHLEQLAVRPGLQRQGIGRMLLVAAKGLALDRGASDLTVMTYADVAWNGPWYAGAGFEEIDQHTHPRQWAALAPLRESEERVGLSRAGRRVGMVAPLADLPQPLRAVSVIPLREKDGVLQAFIQHRAQTMDFVPGAVVFPGGRVDPIDATTAEERGIDILRACAVREVAEETGAGIDPGELIHWDRWVTPIGYPKRFDVEFYVLPVPEGEDFVHATGEATHSEWVPVAALVEQAEAGDVVLVAPTRTIVDELSALESLAAVLALDPAVVPVRHDVTDARPRASQGGVAGSAG